MVHDVLRDAAEQDVGQGTLAMRAHHDQIGTYTLGLGNDGLAGSALTPDHMMLNLGLARRVTGSGKGPPTIVTAAR